MENKKDKNLKKSINVFLDQKDIYNEQEECNTQECVIKNDKSLVERINKKIITEDGRQLLT